MNFKETLALKRKEREAQEALIAEQKELTLQTREIPPVRLPKVQNPSIEQFPLSITKKGYKLDTIRGLYDFATGIGDKTSDKPTLEAKLRKELATRQGLGVFLRNISEFLESN